MPTLRHAPRPSLARCRGGAAVEVMLTITFLFVSIVAMFDLTRMGSELARSHGPARRAAWKNGRGQADAVGSDTAVTVSSVDINVYKPSFGAPPDGKLETGDDGGGSDDFSFAPGGVIGHILGFIEASGARRTTKPTGLMMFPSKEVVATSVVFLDSDRDSSWADEVGWFDPIKWFKDLLVNLFKNVEGLLPTWSDIPGMVADFLGVGGWGDILDGVKDYLPDVPDASGFGK